MFKNQQKVESGGQLELFKKHKRDMSPLERVKLLQEKLYCKAKQEKTFKFYVLYDKVFIPYMLKEAYRRVKLNGGSPGIDNQSFSDIEAYGTEKFLDQLREELRKKTYRSQPVKRVWIPKANGGKRPLGIPTIRDRIAQMACKMVIEPIFEADFEDSSHGFRPGRSSKDAIGAIKGHLKAGKNEVYDADLSKYFDTIPHNKLKKALELRISDPRMLKLINKWLKSVVYEDGDYKGGKKTKAGTPQGGVISPLLANIYMHLLDRIVNNKNSLFHKLGIKIVRYADDFVLMGKKITKAAIAKLKELLERMGLRLNETKTKQVNAREEPFHFLGFTIRYDKDIKGRNKRYWNIVPSAKSEKKAREKLRTYLRARGHYRKETIVSGLNAIQRGWINYFDIPGISYPAMSKRSLYFYLRESLNRYYRRKSQRGSRLYGQQAFELLVQRNGLIHPMKYRPKSAMQGKQ